MSVKFSIVPLTPDQVRSVITLKNAYLEFWESVKFSKGWDAPVAEITEVVHLLEESAEIVIRIRTHLDSTNPAPKFRIIDGNAKEYLWNLESMPKGETFIRELVHATLKHGDKYVEELTKESVDEFIKQVQSYTTEIDKIAVKGKIIEDKILNAWNEADILLKVTCTQEDKFWNASLIKDMQQMLNQIHNLKQRLVLIQKKRDFNNKRGTEATIPPLNNPSSISPPSNPPIQTETDNKVQKEEETLEAKEAREKAEAEAREKELKESQEKEAREKDREGLLKITSVAKDTKVIEEELKEISDIAVNLSKAKRGKAVDTMGKISDLKKKCLKNSTKLMQDLLMLDELVGLHESRAARKQEVLRIQHLLDNVESLKSKLNSLEVEIQPLVTQEQKEEELEKIAQEELEHLVAEQTKQETKSRPEAAEKKPSTDKPLAQKKPEPKQRPEAAEKKPSTDKTLALEKKDAKHSEHTERKPSATLARPQFDLRSAWERLRLDLKMEVHETHDSYILMANIPGIHKDEIETTVLADGTLQISGVRVPTDEELTIMRRQIRARYTPKSNEEEDMLLLKIGVGRFGRFMKKYELPRGVDTNSVHGQYKDGILLIKIPKPVMQPLPRRRDLPVNYGHPFHPYMRDVPFWNQY